jgi:general stress protein 26
MKETSLRSISALRANSKIAYVASVDGAGFPTVRAMLVLEHDGFETQYFSTNTSSQKVAEFRGNKKASIYYCDDQSFKGVLFRGEMEACTDQPTKDFLWREGFECYYPLGVTDPDYCVLKFTAHSGSYYHGLESADFEIAELSSLPAAEHPKDVAQEGVFRAELTKILVKFSESSWALIAEPSKEYLAGANNKNALLRAIEQAKQECGRCGCEYDPLYSRVLALKDYL